MRVCRTGVAILLSSTFFPAVAQRPAVTSHVSVIARDGKYLVLNSEGKLWRLRVAGGTPRQVTEKTPSYYHGWSPDGRTLVYCARRDGNFDIYGVAAKGGAEKRRTASPSYAERRAAHDAAARRQTCARQNQGSSQTVRRPGDHQRVLVAAR
jgi:hypothetical protein